LIQILQQLTRICSKSNVKTCHWKT